MASVQPSKRPKLHHQGSRSNPITLPDDDSSGSVAANFNNPARSESDSLQQLLATFDNLNRTEHLAKVMVKVRIAETQYATIRAEVEKQSQGSTVIQQEIDRWQVLSDMVKNVAREPDGGLQMNAASHGRTVNSNSEKDRRHQNPPIGLASPSPGQIASLSPVAGRICIRARQLCEALDRLSKALRARFYMWEALWDVYDAMTKPGPSSKPTLARQQWEGGDEPSMWQNLMRNEVDVQAAGRQVEELAGAILMEARAYPRHI
ncbi:hypothetical protein Z517_05855 [Fonsecaea pedrosoi CBS 271.37]|uniref:Unplaced genomic scaffold supercont1.4, whole genome shotgun sequence n=1 Tax=Fonsecaea pedrosoi CBS 271.37 TaxID=1442368 RepID=A0A0D2GEL9_9EURO|nr:uncharacterized protein Z517_05855 [Fonsecaea pedrosoi CBS 271.37]KIW79243.1 hypothetical protein Z517_05855 [Fonsecaea pedrosoi CBS 271.37]